MALAAVVLAGAAGAAGCAHGDEVGEQAVDRVLIVSLPGVSWEDVEAGRLPSLRSFANRAAVGDLSTRIGRKIADHVSAYLTMGAGTRAVAPPLDAGVAVDAAEAYRGVPASQLLERRLGEVPEGIAYLALGAARDANESSAFGADVGTLGDELDEAGVRRAVIANADEVEGILNDPPVDEAYHREAATALMGSDGKVPEGSVSRDLLIDDPDAPFGYRVDQSAVLAAFDAVWENDSGRLVALVEASDLTRTAAYRQRATPARAREMRQAALADADALLAELLRRVNPDRDAVLVLSPVAPPGAPALGVAAIQAPGVRAGMLRSATTRRDGYVQLADVAPTVLSLLDEEMTDDIEGRAFRVNPHPGDDRTERLADAADVAEFRDAMVVVVTLTLVGILVLLVLATWFRARLNPTIKAAVPVVALAVLGAVPATFLIGAFDAMAASALVYAGLGVTVAALVAGGALAVDRRVRGAGPIVALGAVILVIAGDMVFGAPLQVNTVFGYSVAVAGRFAGLGNLAFALLGSATVVTAALLADRFGTRGVRVALVLLTVVVLIDGLPVLGADVGGVMSMVPAFGVTALILLGRRVAWRQLVLLAVAAGGAVLVFAFVDLARPPEARTHLARLAEQVLDGRWEPFFDNLSRRWQASFGGAELAAWATIALAAAAVAVYVTLIVTRRSGPHATPRVRHQPTVAAVAGLGLLGALGLVANDSSVAVPATMLIVVVPVIVHRTVLAASEVAQG